MFCSANSIPRYLIFPKCWAECFPRQERERTRIDSFFQHLDSGVSTSSVTSTWSIQGLTSCCTQNFLAKLEKFTWKEWEKGNRWKRIIPSIGWHGRIKEPKFKPYQMKKASFLLTILFSHYAFYLLIFKVFPTIHHNFVFRNFYS